MGGPTDGRRGDAARNDYDEGRETTVSGRAGVFTPGVGFGVFLAAIALFYYAGASRQSEPSLPFPAWKRIETRGGTVGHLVFDADGATLYSGDTTRGSISAWVPTTGRLLARFEEESGSKVTALTLSPDGRLLAGASEHKGPALWDTESGVLSSRLEPRFWRVSAMSFSPDGRELIAAGRDGVVRVYDSSTRRARIFASVPEHGGWTSLAISPDGRVLSLGGNDGSIQSWDYPEGALLKTTRGRHAKVASLASSPDGESLAIGEWEGRFRLWETATHRVRSSSGQSIPSAILCLTFSPDGRLLASGHADRSIRIWDLASNRLVSRFVGHDSFVTALAFTPDGRALASGSADATMFLWDMSKAIVIDRVRANN